MIYITTTRQLNRICAKIYDCVSIDTEFVRNKTYFPTLCLIQINFYDSNNVNTEAVIDVLSEKLNLKCFFTMLKNNKIKKIFHSMGQDYDALKFINKRFQINNFEDTQLMLEFCNLGYNVGYETAVNELLNKDFIKNKKIQISNWLKRPLSRKQIEYSIMDIKYLNELYCVLYKKLIDNGNYEYYKNELEHIKIKKTNQFLLDSAWKKSKIELNEKKLSFIYGFKKITKIREKIAIQNNMIRNNIIDDKDIEQLLLLNNRQYRKKFKNNRFLFGYYNKIIKIVEQTKRYKSSKIFYNREHNFPKKQQMHNLYENIIQLTNRNNIDVNVLITKSDIIALLQKYQSRKSILYGWKIKLLNGILFNI